MNNKLILFFIILILNNNIIDEIYCDDNIVKVECEITYDGQSGVGNVLIDIHPDWSPHGTKRFLDLVRDGYYDGTALFRCIRNSYSHGFLVQFGITPNNELKKKWRKIGTIPDDPHLGIPIKRGTLSFAGGGKDSRLDQVFFAFGQHKGLGSQLWETPLGEVVVGMDEVIGRCYNKYGDCQPFNKNGVSQGRLQNEGYGYLEKEFPNLDYINHCKILDENNENQSENQLENEKLEKEKQEQIKKKKKEEEEEAARLKYLEEEKKRHEQEEILKMQGLEKQRLEIEAEKQRKEEEEERKRLEIEAQKQSLYEEEEKKRLEIENEKKKIEEQKLKEEIEKKRLEEEEHKRLAELREMEKEKLKKIHESNENNKDNQYLNQAINENENHVQYLTTDQSKEMWIILGGLSFLILLYFFIKSREDIHNKGGKAY